MSQSGAVHPGAAAERRPISARQARQPRLALAHRSNNALIELSS